ncbi:unnamed protein product, partial [Hapterophycus canaliculatus]
VIRTFNFSAGGSLVGIHRVAGEAPRRLVFRRRERLLNPAEAKTAKGAVSTAASCRAGVQTRTVRSVERRGEPVSRSKGKPRAKESDHPMASWLKEWTERKERGWDGDVPPIAGLSLREESERLLAQASQALIPFSA